MNKVKKKVYRNTTSFNMMAWGSFAFFVILMLVGLYTLKEPLMVKGYYLMGCVGLISSSFTPIQRFFQSSTSRNISSSVILTFCPCKLS